MYKFKKIIRKKININNRLPNGRGIKDVVHTNGCTYKRYFDPSNIKTHQEFRENATHWIEVIDPNSKK